MESLGVITKVTEPTAWVSSLVIIQKPDSDKLRVCLDPKELNAAISRPHYPSRRLEEILPEFVDAYPGSGGFLLRCMLSLETPWARGVD